MITPIPTSLSNSPLLPHSSPFSTVEEQQINQKRKREEEEMGCESPQQTTNIPHFQFHPTTPEKSSPYSPNPNILQRMQGDTCCYCGQQGHWATYCPNKTPNSTNNNHSPVVSSDKKIWCRCGHGACLVKTAHTAKNNGREFFACPIRLGKPCGNFKWCDGTIHESDLQRPLFEYPVCQCIAGVCKKVMETGVTYFVCPIQQGHGSCGYRVSEDELFNNASIDEPVDNTGIVPNQQSKQRSLNEYIEGDQVDTAGKDLANDFAEGSVLLLTTKRMRITDGSVNPSPVAVSEIPEGTTRGSPIEEDNSQPVGFPEIEFEDDLESINLALRVAIEAEASLSSRFSTPSRISYRQSVFQGDIISADASFGSCPMGWLGRLIFFHPTRSLKSPTPKPFFCCMFQSFDPMDVPKQTSTLHSQSECNDLVIKSPNQCTQLSTNVVSPDRSPGSEKLKERKQREAVIFMQQGLLNDLEGFDFHQHESMRDTAEAAFSVLNCLRFDYKQFSDYVWEFINLAKSMTEIDKSMENSPTLEEHSKFLEEEKVRLANIWDDCVKIETMLAVSDEKRNLLSEEVANLQAVLLEKQKELKSCELEKMNAETGLDDMKRRMSEVDLTVKDKARQAETARKKSVERETKQVAAKTALEKAKGALEK